MRVPLSIALAVLLMAPSTRAQTTPVQVPAFRETVGALGSGQVVQGSTVWLNPVDPSRSLLLVADNFAGLLVYSIDGSARFQQADGPVQGVDVQDGFVAGTDGGIQSLVMVANTSSGLVSYTIDPSTLAISRAGIANFTPSGITPNSLALYANAQGRLFVFVGSATGQVAQYAVTPGTDGGISPTALRTFTVGNAVVGLTVDDALGQLYVAERNRGIWRYGAESDAGDARAAVDDISQGLVSPVGGLALYAGTGSDGYLLAAGAGDNAVRVYKRNPADQARVGSFVITQDGGVDAVDFPRVLAVTNRPLGTLFPQGMVAVQDSANTGENENFKLVPWNTVATAFEPDLLINTGAPTSPDAGSGDGGTSGDGGSVIVGPPPDGPPVELEPEEETCGCSSASVPGTVMLLAAGLLLVRRRSSPR